MFETNYGDKFLDLLALRKAVHFVVRQFLLWNETTFVCNETTFLWNETTMERNDHGAKRPDTARSALVNLCDFNSILEKEAGGFPRTVREFPSDLISTRVLRMPARKAGIRLC